MLQIKGVRKQFGTFTAVEGLNLEIPKGEIFGLLGANGAGKTTTFRMILGLLTPTQGTITWNQKEISYQTSDLVGYLPEERGLYPKLTVKEQLIYLGQLRGMSRSLIQEQADKWLNRFGAEEYLNKKVESLSKGNQQKIQFIAAVIHRPELLILDEPFSGLDPVNVELLKNAVHELKKEGTTIVFSSHRMEHVEELCQHLCIMHRGKSVVQGNLKEIKRSFGKKNVSVKADFDLTYLKDTSGVISHRMTADGITLQVEREEVAHSLFKAVQSKGFVRKFELEEPSLNDIFIEKVGVVHE
ncbi:ABC transporter ATP-binding protein [Fictibacillus phosphorivorans]|uniref:ABC transporter ATP-binding protein n=1 Tax=Fictibacillus phosphorivorans TaxID=1221500 RepID=UPI00203A72A8|nr:ABC transporter ATP-binding protein [Fictibacillus phosphorivorans]MCM3717511.1 ABC transporter ATP-binding protein [Fictibacillus phosphorivorans]MCM3775206.1 ABC transporter ATP-binding protein [Fictibacillus phosphorivorans]